jgi:hypothetical protein
MTIRYPLYIDNGNLRAMTDANLVQWRKKAIYQYSLDPSALLTVVSNSGANMAAITDTRLTSGTAAVGAGNSSPGVQAADFPTGSAGALGNTADVSFDKINFAYDTDNDQDNDTDGRSFPVYADNEGNIRAMSLSDMQDTFLHPAIDLMVVADTNNDDPNVAGTYRIHTVSSLTDFTEVSGANTAIFRDTTSTGFAAGSIGTAGSTQTGTASTVQDFFLLRRDGTDVTPDHSPMYITDSGNLQTFSIGAAGTLLGNWLKYTAAQSADGYKITYAIGASVSGTQRGSAITNKQLDSNTVSTTSVGDNDYRAQRFPSGSATVTNTYLFKINKA